MRKRIPKIQIPGYHAIVVDKIKVDPKKGLNADQVRKMKRAGAINESVKPPSKTVSEIVRGNVFTYFNFVFLVITIILICVQSWRDITFLPLIIANTLIGIFQEIRAKAVLDKLTMLNAPTARVIREGKEQEIIAEKLVQNDVVVFRAGNQIPADAVILSGEVAVNEALLTGEADEIRKGKDGELMSGSFIVSGECVAQLTKVGAASYISQLTLQAKKVKNKEQSEIIRSLNKIVTIAGFLIIPIGGILFYQSHFVNGLDMKASVQSAVASVLGMIPEGLFLLSTIALAVSSMKLAQKKVLLHDMKSIETLARVNVLCVDKTGTITENTMAVSDYEPIDKMKKSDLNGLLSDFVGAQAADNATMGALKAYFSEPDGRKIVSVAGFSSQYKYSGVNFEDESYVLGAPEFVLGNDYEKYQDKIEGYGRKGYRVLVFGKYEGLVEGKKLDHKFEPLGLIMLSNPIRPNAVETFSFFNKQGVDIKVISGDNPVTVSEVAQKAKIKGAEKYVDASTLQTDESIAKAMREYTVFGRVTPEQKRKFVKAMQRDGKIVAMTGDGVNDVLALRDADCSVAMASGSEAAAQAAQLVLLESDFARMPDVVAEGRQVVNNLERSGSLFLVKNIFSVITSLIVILFAITYPLIPAQISLISMFTIGIPGFLLSQAPNHDLIKGVFVSNILKRATPGGLADVVLVALMVVLGKIFSLPENDISTACTILIAAVGFIMVWRASKPVDWYKKACFFICLAGLVFCYFFLSDFFGMSMITLQTAVILLALVIASFPLVQGMCVFVDWLWKAGGKFIIRVRDYTHANEIQNPFLKIDEDN